MRTGIIGAVALGLMVTGCGINGEQRAATGALTGAGVGAVVGGPIGAVAGLAVGGAVGVLLPQGADKTAENVIRSGRQDLMGSGSSTPPRAPVPLASDSVVRDAQIKLATQDLYDGPIDGVLGPETRQAIVAFQRERGLVLSATLDQPTIAQLGIGQPQPAAATTSPAPPTQ